MAKSDSQKRAGQNWWTKHPEYLRDYKKKNAEKEREYQRQWHRAHPNYAAELRARKGLPPVMRHHTGEVKAANERRRLQRAAWRAEHSHAEWPRERAHRLPPGAFQKMWDAQGGGCAICKSMFSSRSSAHIDHNHVTGIVRALLCGRCNWVVGLIETSEVAPFQDYITTHG